MSKVNAIKLFKTDVKAAVFTATIRSDPHKPLEKGDLGVPGWSVHVYPRKAVGPKTWHTYCWIVWHGDSIHDGVEAAIIDGAVVKTRTFKGACSEAVMKLIAIEAYHRKAANARATHAKTRAREYKEMGGQ